MTDPNPHRICCPACQEWEPCASCQRQIDAEAAWSAGTERTDYDAMAEHDQDLWSFRSDGPRIGDVVGYWAPGATGYGFAWVVIATGETLEGWIRCEITNLAGFRIANVEAARLTLAERPRHLRPIRF